MHATAGRPPRNFQVVCSRPSWHMKKARNMKISVNFSLQRTHLEGCEKIGAVNPQTKHWAATNLGWTLVGGGGANGFWRVLSQNGGGRICQKNGLSILRTTCCLFWWKWKYIFLESFESVNSRRKTPSCERTKTNISLEAKNKNHNN